MTKKVLITGGAGFIGFHLAKLLHSKKYDVTIIDDLSRGEFDDEFEKFLSKDRVKFIEADMTEKSFFKELDSRYDGIYHLAAVNGTKNFYDFPETVLKVNILSLMNILEWINKENCGKFVFASSSESYAATITEFGEFKNFIPTDETIPLTINDVFNPRFSYGGSKLIGELLTINLLKDVEYSIIRYHNIYGPRMGFDHVIPDFCERIYDKRDPFPIYGGSETRTFCFVTDAVNATFLVMENKNTDGEVVNIGDSDNELEIVDVAKLLFGISNFKPKLDIQNAPDGSVKRRYPNIEKLKSLTNFYPKVTLENGLKETYQWYMDKYSQIRK